MSLKIFLCPLLSCFSKITFFPYTDIRERFYYIVLVVIVTLRNLTEFNWNAGECYGTLLKGVEKVSSEQRCPSKLGSGCKFHVNISVKTKFGVPYIEVSQKKGTKWQLWLMMSWTSAKFSLMVEKTRCFISTVSKNYRFSKCLHLLFIVLPCVD